MAEQRTFEFEGGWVTVNVDAEVMAMPRERRDALFVLLDTIEGAVGPLGEPAGASPAKVLAKPSGRFGCDRCERSFGTEHGMLVHQRRVHKPSDGERSVPERTFGCEDCSASFPTQRQLRAHAGQSHKAKRIVPAPPPAVTEKPKGNPLDRFGDPGPIAKRPFDAEARRGAAAAQL